MLRAECCRQNDPGEPCHEGPRSTETLGRDIWGYSQLQPLRLKTGTREVLLEGEQSRDLVSYRSSSMPACPLVMSTGWLCSPDGHSVSVPSYLLRFDLFRWVLSLVLRRVWTDSCLWAGNRAPVICGFVDLIIDFPCQFHMWLEYRLLY